MIRIEEEQEFVEAFHNISAKAYTNSYNHGFWPENLSEANQAEKICLMHSELSEALEAIRKPCRDNHCPGFQSLEVELADTIIRIMDFACAYNLNVARAVIAKMKFNESRPVKHGKAF